MAATSPGTMADDVFVILAQIFGAFAQGSDGLYIDPKVILAARDDYAPAIEKRKHLWPAEAAQILRLTKAMARLAAHLALAGGEVTITVAHYTTARRRMVLIKPVCDFHADHLHP